MNSPVVAEFAEAGGLPWSIKCGRRICRYMSYKKEEVSEFVQNETRLPSTHRHGYGSRRNDVADGGDGRPVYVPTPETPDDRFGG